MQYHKYSLNELEDMIPCSEVIYVEMLMQTYKRRKRENKRKTKRGQ